MSGLPENLRCHVAWGTTSCRQDVKLLFIHNSRQSKVGDEKICVVFRSAEKQVLGLEIAMDNAMVVQICNGGKGSANEVCGIRLVVVALSTNAVE